MLCDEYEWQQEQEMVDFLNCKAAEIGLPRLKWFWVGSVVTAEGIFSPSQFKDLICDEVCLLEGNAELPVMLAQASGGQQSFYAEFGTELSVFNKGLIELAAQCFEKKLALLCEAFALHMMQADQNTHQAA